MVGSGSGRCFEEIEGKLVQKSYIMGINRGDDEKNALFFCLIVRKGIFLFDKSIKIVTALLGFGIINLIK